MTLNGIANNLFYVAFFLSGAALFICGLATSIYKNTVFSMRSKAFKRTRKPNPRILESITSIFPLVYVRKKIRGNLALVIADEEQLKLVSNLLIIFLLLISFLLIFLLNGVGQLWYVKILLTAMCLILPFYAADLMFDLFEHRISRDIPRLIDEFRSAFVKENKVKASLKECSRHVNKSLGKIINRAADSSSLEKSLTEMQHKFNNVWFSMFIALLSNYKNNGGELINQLYRLNYTMTRHNNIEKKKSKRLIWYELFAVCSSIFSIPAVFWLNNLVLGDSSSIIIDSQTNLMISRIIAFSIVCLVITRILRKV